MMWETTRKVVIMQGAYIKPLFDYNYKFNIPYDTVSITIFAKFPH